MNVEIAFTVKDLLLLGLGLALIALVIYLVLALREVLLSLKEIRSLVTERRLEIDEILQKAPNIVGSVDRITGIAAKGVDGAYNGAMNIVNKFKGE